jgi:hypothetical protein
MARFARQKPERSGGAGRKEIGGKEFSRRPRFRRRKKVNLFYANYET